MADQPSLSFNKGLSLVVVVLAAVLVVGFVQVSGDQADERTALEMIIADLETDSVEMTAMLNRGRIADANVLWILRNMDAPPDSVMTHLMRLFYYTSYQQVRVGYDNLLNAGRLSVISNRDLRQDLVRYYEVAQPYMWEFYTMYMDVYKEFKETTAPFMVLDADSEGETFRESFQTEWVRPWSEMRSDVHFRYKLTELGGAGSQFALRLEPVLERNGELREAVEAELGM